MEFDKSKVYTSLNADELKLGSKVICANTLESLKFKVGTECDIMELEEVREECEKRRFRGTCRGAWPLAYLVSEPEEKNWIVYLCRKGPSNPEDYYLTACRNDRWEIVQKDYGAKTKLFEGSKDESEDWYVARKHFTDVIAAWEDGETIQYNSGNGWEDCCDNRPAWDVTSTYRIKPEGLKWTDLKLGDIIKCKTVTRMVTGIDTSDESDEDSDFFHICASGWWYSDKQLEEYKIVVDTFLAEGFEGDETDYNTRAILYVITPEKERVEVNRYYGEKDGRFVEITKREYKKRLKNRKENE